MTDSSNEQLEAQLAALKVENERLKLGLPKEPAAQLSKGGRRWRAAAAVVLVAIGVVLTPVAVVGSWARSQLADTSSFVNTFAPLADDPAVQRYLANQLTTTINNSIDIDGITQNLFSSLGNLDLPSQASQALGMLEGPAVEGLRMIISRSVDRVVSSDVFRDAVRQSLRLSHEQFIKVVQGAPGTTLVLSDSGSVGIAIGPLIEQVRSQLLAQGIRIANLIPTVNTTIVVAQSDQLALLRPAYQLSVAVGGGLPWVALGFVLLGVFVAVNRRRALFGSALALGVVCGSLAAGFGIAQLVFVVSVAPTIMPADVAVALFAQLTAHMATTAIALSVVCFAIAAVTWYLALSSGQRLRTFVGKLVGSLRDRLTRYGMNTGRFGAWLETSRFVLRWVIGAAAAAAVLLAWPITGWFVFWTVLLALLALLLLELLRRPEPVELVASPAG